MPRRPCEAITSRYFWARAQSLGLHRGAAPGLVGMLWALLPCGLLYSAVMVSALAGSVAGGALLMALFALGSGISMLAGPWLWLRWVARTPSAAATGSERP
jgi:sulfite exporter TauE/SafE